MNAFDSFVGVDWSGAVGAYAGISVARCGTGTARPRLVPPPGGRWTRARVAEWLVGEIAAGWRLLVGFDFAFGFPYEPHCGYLGGRAKHIDAILDLWSLVDDASGMDCDFGCTSFVTNPSYAPLFWTNGARPDHWIERRRQAERACGLRTGTYPESLYKLIGPKQVGKASMTGMRVLRTVREATNGQLAVWPFECGRDSIFVEIYPTLFRNEATGSVAKIRTVDRLNQALRHFGSRAARMAPGPISDHDSDALISAAGLRAFAQERAIWDMPTAVRREGWIFGVPCA